MMKVQFLLLALLLSASISAQLDIKTGSQFTIVGNMKLTLQNADLINDGNFVAGNSMTSFTGNASSSVSGNQPVQFFEVNIKKSNNSSVLLQQGVGITNRILFSSGFMDLNGFDADLGTTARLDSEQENSRIIGANGGQVSFRTTLNAPNAANPANLGAILTSAQNLGNVIIRRGHQAQHGSTLINSILRYYDITADNNLGLSASLKFTYFDGELNSLSKIGLVIYKSDDSIHWADMGFSSEDSSAKYVEYDAIDTLMRWTLGEDTRILAQNFLFYNARCDENGVSISWTTALEQNIRNYEIERSEDGISWTVIADLSALDSNSSENNYSYTDHSPLQNGYYRVAQYTNDAAVQYSAISGASCNVTNLFNIRPNPAQSELQINLTCNSESEGLIRIFDSKGSVVLSQKTMMTKGINLIRLDIGRLANATYFLSVEWGNGQMKKTAEIIKQ